MLERDASRGRPSVLRLTPYYFLSGRSLSRRELQYEPIGGMQVQIAQVTEDLDALGIPQTVVAPRRPGLPRELRSGKAIRMRLLRVPVAPVRTRSKGYIGLLVSWGLAVTAWCARCRLRRRRHEYSLIHVHCSELPWTFFFARVVATVLGLPLVLTVHCSAIATFHPETLLGRVLLGPARLAERFALRRADAVVVLTERIRRVYVEGALVASERVVVIPDGVRRATFAPMAEPHAETPIVAYCGRFAPEKGWIDFVKAAATLAGHGRRVRFVMCGDGNELAACRREIDQRNLGGVVELPGHLERREVAELIRRAAVVVVPSRHEELGGTVLEALSTGRAVVATAVGGLPEIIEDGVNGLLVPPADPAALAAAIGRLLDDPRLRGDMGRTAVELAGRFSAGRIAQQLSDLYCSVLAEAGATPQRWPEGLPEAESPVVAAEMAS